jgi:hypothetical protein
VKRSGILNWAMLSSAFQITGKPYEFGGESISCCSSMNIFYLARRMSHRCYCADLSRAIDSSVKDKVKDLTGNDDYEFGDLR